MNNQHREEQGCAGVVEEGHPVFCDAIQHESGERAKAQHAAEEDGDHVQIDLCAPKKDIEDDEADVCVKQPWPEALRRGRRTAVHGARGTGGLPVWIRARIWLLTHRMHQRDRHLIARRGDAVLAAEADDDAVAGIDFGGSAREAVGV
jgi:hypothetical protein